MTIKGQNLNDRQRALVLAAFVHRHHAIGAGKRYADDRAWIIDHAFYFIKDGSRLALNRRYCEPAYGAGLEVR
jgi:hypothetical protein